MKFHLITLFEEACDAYLNASIVGRARKEKKILIKYQNPRDFVDNKWGKVDERPYGGGPGMVMTALPVVKAVEKALGREVSAQRRASDARLCAPSKKQKLIIWFSPSAKQFTNKDADALTKYDDVILICGRYEGIDERAKKILKSRARESQNHNIKIKEFSVGEAIYTGGEIPSLAIIDATTRRIPGALGNDTSVEEKRIASSAVYTRPEIVKHKDKKYRVPKVLQTGNHADIDTWRAKK